METGFQSWQRDDFLISTDKSLLEPLRIQRFLSTEAYWSLGIPQIIVDKALRNSLCFGVYDRKNKFQVGFARVVTDSATFAWVCDVYIEKSHRKLGLAKWLMECVKAHRELQNLRRLCLATKDAHELYKKFGFEVTLAPGNWLEIKDNDLYRRLAQS